MYELGDKKINSLILKWSNSLTSTWNDVAKDLVKLCDDVRKEEQERISYKRYSITDEEFNIIKD
jgi:hypothetical protein